MGWRIQSSRLVDARLSDWPVSNCQKLASFELSGTGHFQIGKNGRLNRSGRGGGRVRRYYRLLAPTGGIGASNQQSAEDLARNPQALWSTGNPCPEEPPIYHGNGEGLRVPKTCFGSGGCAPGALGIKGGGSRGMRRDLPPQWTLTAPTLTS